ncbi:hypothetical protein BHE74_00017567 [Ensete ventricosum]|nr:hypothetical protein BHE74_00017567 [Ensete ventricosum]RZR93914.1 hypothetical protein BHM03_00022498 [Ensete ventricosum]
MYPRFPRPPPRTGSWFPESTGVGSITGDRPRAWGSKFRATARKLASFGGSKNGAFGEVLGSVPFGEREKNSILLLLVSAFEERERGEVASSPVSIFYGGDQRVETATVLSARFLSSTHTLYTS